MSTQIDIIRKRREPGQGCWVRIEEIGKAPTATLDHPLLVLRGKRQSHTATWRKSPKNTEGNVPLAASVANELEKRDVGTSCRIFAQNHDLPGTVAGSCRRRNAGTGAKDDR